MHAGCSAKDVLPARQAAKPGNQARGETNIRLFIIVLVLACSIEARAEPDAQQRMFDRLQQQQQMRQQQQLDDMHLPGEQGPRAVVPEPSGGPCFPVATTRLLTLDGAPPPFTDLLGPTLESVHGHCLAAQDIRALQAVLTNILLDHGYVTSRILVPEQDLGTGLLQLVVVPGRLESLQAEGMPERLLRWALPATPGELLNLRALEHAVETLSRLPTLHAEMDLAPGETQGGTVVIGHAEWPRRVNGALVINGRHYGAVEHATGQLSLTWGSPFGVTDRLSLTTNRDLNQTFSDQAWGLGLDYDISLGYWNLALGYNRQAYENRIAGIFQRFDTGGLTEVGRLELTRLLHRSGTARLSLSLLGAYTDVENHLEDVVIQVSSYRLRTAGLRLSGKQLLGHTQLAGSFTAERTWAAGPATAVPGVNGSRSSVADPVHSRYQLYLTASRRIMPLHGVLQVRMHSQYSRNLLFPSERLSIASSAAVRGFDGVAASANSATVATLQYDSLPLGSGAVRLSPFVGTDVGLISHRSNETGSMRLVSASTGVTMSYQAIQFTAQLSRPLTHSRARHSMEGRDNDFTAVANLYVAF